MRKICACILMLSMIMTLGSSCKKDAYSTEKIPLNILVLEDDVYGRNIREKLINEFGKKYDFYDLNIKKDLTIEKIITQINKGEIDIVFCAPKYMRALEAEGLLSNLNNVYYKRNLFDRTYSCINSYGRIQNLFYGFPLYASTFELFYNIESLEKMGINEEEHNIMALLKKFGEMGVEIPIIDGNDEPEEYLLGVLMSNYTYLNNFEIHKTEMKYGFQMFRKFNDEGILKTNIFRSGNRDELDKFKKGEIPLIIANSCTIPEYRNKDIGVWDNYKFQDYWIAPPSYVDTLVCFPIITNNEKGQKEFIRYFTSNDFLKELEEENIITHDSNVNKDYGGLNLYVTKHLETSSQNSMMYNEFLKAGMRRDLKEVLKKTLSGEITEEKLNEELELILTERKY